ncbi:MAG: 4-hydroxy-tetrahydrodipicolinate synthase [Verrucomicrobia bacterium]|nr:4-hydroxy-tetrahydrodipicolinate synthase [Verrucomicrobiota bacterium]
MMFRGSIAAVITPFTWEGEVDYSAFKNLIDWHAVEGTDAIVVCGTTGEAPTLTYEEQFQLFKTALDVANKRVPIIAGTGTYNTRKTIENTAHAKALGADACLVVVPYYNKPTPEGCIAHYTEVSKVGLPMIVYHHPGRTGIKLSAEVLAQIARLPSVVAIKEASGGLELIQEIQQMSDIPIFSGDDTLTYAMLELGAAGGISIVANMIPRAWKEMIHSFFQGNRTYAKELDTLYAPLYKSLVLENNPQGVKYGMSLLGKCTPHMRLPLVQPREATKLAILQAVTQVKLKETYH